MSLTAWKPLEHGAWVSIKSPLSWACSHTSVLSKRASSLLKKNSRTKTGLEQKERSCPGNKPRARGAAGTQEVLLVPTCALDLGHMLGPEPAPPRSLTLCLCVGGYVKPGKNPRHFFIKNRHVENLFLVKAATWWTSGYMTQSEVKEKSLSPVQTLQPHGL